jgi:hypothetical protein
MRLRQRLRQLPLFDAPEGERRKECGMDLAAAQAGTAWGEYALDVLERVCRRNRYVHTDDLAAALEWHPVSGNAMGAVWQRALKRGWIVRTGATRPSAQPGKHAHRYECYRSTIYGQEPGA